MGSQEPLVSVLVVTHNRKEELARCIESVVGQTYSRLEIVVVDNGSGDGTSDMIRATFPGVRLVRSAVNLGCPSGRNFGFGFCAGTYIYMLDDDGWLDPEAIKHAVARAESDPRIGVVMSRVNEVHADGGIVPRDAREAGFCQTFSGGCSLVRRAILETVGGFPEDYVRQGEEQDLAIRMIDAGYYCYYEPASIMYHAPSPVGRDQKQFIYYTLRNSTRTSLKYWPAPWCVVRPAMNIIHAFRYAWIMRAPLLPFRVFAALVVDLPRSLRSRSPVTRKSFSAYRRLARSGGTNV